MKQTKQSRIDDLSAAGHELHEQHLALAAGGRRPRSRIVTTCRDGGGIFVCDVMDDVE